MVIKSDRRNINKKFMLNNNSVKSAHYKLYHFYYVVNNNFDVK